MKTGTFGGLFEAGRARNRLLVERYDSLARRALSRPASRLAAAAAEQRRDLEADLAALAEKLAPGLAGVEMAYEEFLELSPPPLQRPEEAREAIAFVRAEEDRDRELWELLSSRVPGGLPDLAEALRQIADAARKREATAADHLDLLGFSPT
jgi:hypothetical protein